MNDRIVKLIGNMNYEKLKSKNILLCGLGGVGGSCFDSLVRSGIENIFVVDFDCFEESNLNRQILCNKNNIGIKKTKIAKEYAKNINKNVNISIFDCKIDSHFFDNFNKKIDYIIDAIDDVPAKIILIKYAIDNNIKIISAGATGSKLQPQKLEISNIWKTENDPLAKKIRSCLRKEKINYKLPVVFSKEPVINKTKEVIPSMAMVPNTAGILLASYIINDILNN